MTLTNEPSCLAVLTQERLLRIFKKDPSLAFDCIIIDEAHEMLENDYRSKILADVTKQIPNVIYNSDDFAEVRNTVVSAYEDVLNNNKDIASTLNDAANQISSATGRAIAK